MTTHVPFPIFLAQKEEHNRIKRSTIDHKPIRDACKTSPNAPMSHKVKGALRCLANHCTFQPGKASQATKQFVATAGPFVATPWLLGALRLPRRSQDTRDLSKTRPTVKHRPDIDDLSPLIFAPTKRNRKPQATNTHTQEPQIHQTQKVTHQNHIGTYSQICTGSFVLTTHVPFPICLHKRIKTIETCQTSTDKKKQPRRVQDAPKRSNVT